MPLSILVRLHLRKVICANRESMIDCLKKAGKRDVRSSKLEVGCIQRDRISFFVDIETEAASGLQDG